MRPNRATAASTATRGSPGSARSSFATSVAAPSAAASRAVSSSVPGSGLVAERRMVEECSRRSAPVTVRAVSARSKPRRASSSAHPRPMPRLEPVMKAIFRSAIVSLLLAARPEMLDVAARDSPAVGGAHQVVAIAHADGAAAAVRQPVLCGAVGAAVRGIAVDLDALPGDRVTGSGVAPHGGGKSRQRVGDRAGGERAAITGVGREAGSHQDEVARIDATGVAQEQLADRDAIVDLLVGHLWLRRALASSNVRPMTKRRFR